MINFNDVELENKVYNKVIRNLDVSNELEIITKLNAILSLDADGFQYKAGNIVGKGESPRAAMHDFCQVFYNGWQ